MILCAVYGVILPRANQVLCSLHHGSTYAQLHRDNSVQSSGGVEDEGEGGTAAAAVAGACARQLFSST
jgi:hypothetical protein